jgi:energy-coupling factor transport system substrate-specific component
MAEKAKQVVLPGVLGGVLAAAQWALGWLPNVELVSLLLLVWGAVLGRRALLAAWVFSLIELVLWGPGLWWVAYLYVWPIPAALGWLLRRMDSSWGWAAVSGLFGLSFGTLCAPVWLLAGGWEAALGFWLAGLPFDAIHGAGNFVLALALFRPLRRATQRLAGGAVRG